MMHSLQKLMCTNEECGYLVTDSMAVCTKCGTINDNYKDDGSGIKLFEQSLGDDWVCATSQKEAFEFHKATYGDESDCVEESDWEVVSKDRLKTLMMMEHEGFGEPVSFEKAMMHDIISGKNPPYLFASINW